MLEIIRVTNEQMANECDSLLTKLIQSERKYDNNVKPTYIVKDWFKNKYQQNILYVASLDNNIIGYIYGYIENEAGEFVHEGVAKIDSLYVEEKYRSQGIASKLIDTFTNFCREKNVTILEISVYKNNENALNLYKKRGFEIDTYHMKTRI